MGGERSISEILHVGRLSEGGLVVVGVGGSGREVRERFASGVGFFKTFIVCLYCFL